MGLIPGQGTEIRYAVRCGKDETKVKEMYSWIEESFQNYTHSAVSFFFFLEILKGQEGYTTKGNSDVSGDDWVQDNWSYFLLFTHNHIA